MDDGVEHWTPRSPADALNLTESSPEMVTIELRKGRVNLIDVSNLGIAFMPVLSQSTNIVEVAADY